MRKNWKRLILTSLATFVLQASSGITYAEELIPAEELAPVEESVSIEEPPTEKPPVVESVPVVESPVEESIPVEEKSSEPETKFETSISDRDKFDDYPFSIEGRFFSPHFDANVKSNKIYYNGGTVGLKDNLGFGNDNAPEIILRYKRLSLDYIYIHGSGHKTYSGSDVLIFGGRRYRGQIDAKNTLHYLKFNVTNPIKMTEDGGLTWSYGLTGIFWKGKVSGTDSRGRSESRSEDFGAPLPTLGVGAQINILPQFHGYANISGMYFGHYGHFYDFEAGIKYKPAPHFAITASYRKIEVKVDHKDDYGKLKMNGPYAGLRFDF